LKSGTTAIVNNALTLSLPKLSVTAVVLTTNQPTSNQSVLPRASTFSAQVHHGQLQIDLPAYSGVQQVRLLNLQGALVSQWSIPSGQTHLTLTPPSHEQGSYLVQIPNLGYRAIALTR